MKRNIDKLKELSEEIQTAVHKEIDKYFYEATYSLPKLSEKINSITGMTTNRKSVSKLLLELGYERKSADLVKMSKIKNASEDMRFKSEQQLDEKEKELLQNFSKSELIKAYYSGKSIVNLEQETGVSAYYLNMIFKKWEVKLRPLPKTAKEIVQELIDKGYTKEKLVDQYHGNNLTMKEFVNFMSSIIDYPITLRMGERIVKNEGLQKPLAKVKENQGMKSRTEFDQTIANINKAGFQTFQELADFFDKNRNITYKEMAERLNTNLSAKERQFNVRWLERHIMPLLPPDRSIGVSRLEMSIKEYISTLVSEEEFHCSDRKLIAPQELDFVFPSKNIAIEVNGLYWHSEKFGRDNNYHYDKWEKCQEQGIQLITIWEDDWRDRKEVIQRVIAHKLGVSTNPTIGARKTYIDEKILFEECSKLLNDNHIQGDAVGSHYLGLRDKNNDELVAVAVLQQAKDKQGFFELIRYGTDRTVQGGFTKILRYIEKSMNAVEITTFSDNEISDGSLYKNNGFVKISELKPDYKYVHKLTRKHKFLFRKDRFRTNPELKFEEGLTERELAELNGLYRIYDSGKVKWSKKFNDHIRTDQSFSG